MKILLLGGNGMLGSSIKNELKKKKFNFLSPNSKELDLTNQNQIQTLCSKMKFSHIINCAGRVGGILDNYSNQIDYYEKNMEINYNLIKASKKNKIKNFINFGSSCMYPKNINTKMSEDLLMTGPLEESNFTYALTKINAAYYLKAIREKYNYNYTTLIPCNLFGENDKFQLETAHLIPAIINKVYNAKMNNLKEITIWGSGQVKREFLYVKNVSDFIIKHLNKNTQFPAFLNIGASKDYSIISYYKQIIKLFNIKLKITKDLNKPEGIKRKLIDSKNARKNFEWKVKYDLTYGLNKTILFYKKNYVSII